MFDFLYQGFGWLLGFIYSFTSHYGISIILMTIVVKLALFPLTQAQTKSQQSMNELQPKIQELNRKYKNDKEKLNEETLKLYKEHNVNPLAGCLPMLIQFPIIIALFGVLRDPLKYVFANNVELFNKATNQAFLWIKDFSQPDTLSTIINLDFAQKLPGLLPILAAVLTYISFKTMSNKPQNNNKAGANDTANNMMKSMQLFMPLMILWFGMTMAAGLTLYWVVSTAFQIGQQLIISKKKTEEV